MPYLRHVAQRSFDHPVIIELGTRTGNSTISFLAGCVESGGTVWSCDKAVSTGVPQSWYEFDSWHFLWSDDREPRAQAWLPQPCDILFIDTSHEYEHTLWELHTYVPRVRPGGVVLCHDTQFYPPGSDYGEPIGEVAKALDAYCSETGLRWTNRPTYYGLGVLPIPSW